MVIRISEGPAAADRHEARVPELREDHGQHPSACIRPPFKGARGTRHALKQHLRIPMGEPDALVVKVGGGG